MTIKKPSFFERLSGSSVSGDVLDAFDEELPTTTMPAREKPRARTNESTARPAPLDDDIPGNEGQLPVDVNQTVSDIIIRAFVAGVGPDYFTRELFWGSFSRTIMLPQEVDVEASSASAKDGLLTIILPKLDKARQTKLRVKAG